MNLAEGEKGEQGDVSPALIHHLFLLNKKIINIGTDIFTWEQGKMYSRTELYMFSICWLILWETNQMVNQILLFIFWPQKSMIIAHFFAGLCRKKLHTSATFWLGVWLFDRIHLYQSICRIELYFNKAVRELEWSRSLKKLITKFISPLFCYNAPMQDFLMIFPR